MKQNSIALTQLHNEPEIEKLMESSDAELKALAVRSARHYAAENRPLVSDDSLLQYIPEIIGGYERTASDILRLLQPETHFPDGKMDIERTNQKKANLDWEIEELEKKVRIEEPLIKDHDEREFNFTKRKILWVILLMMAGETTYNTGSFQLISENPIFTLLLSVAITIAVLLAGHTTASLYKKAETRKQKIAVVGGSLLAMSLLFFCFALLRTWYLHEKSVEINPLLFVIFNLFFFVVMCLISYFYLPSWEELRRNRQLERINTALKRKKAELSEKKNFRDKLIDSLHDLNKTRVRSIHYAKYLTDSIRARFKEAAGLFMSTNNRYRTDRKTPDCFSQTLPELKIDDTYFTSSILNRQQSNSQQ